MKTLSIIDTFGFFFSSYHALPPLVSSSGHPTGLLTGFINFVSNLQSELDTDSIVFALDSKTRNFRLDIDPNYKANRKPAPDELKVQLPIAIDFIKKMGFMTVEVDHLEADDIIYSLCQRYEDEYKIKVVTYDKDLYQLINKNIQIYNPRLRTLIDEQGCIEKFGVKPSQIRDYLSILGDASDNIPGVKGIGAKGAKKLLDDFGSFHSIYENLGLIPNKRTALLLQESKENAFMSYELVGLKDTEIDIEDEDMAFPKDPVESIKDELDIYDIKAVTRRIKKVVPTIKFDSILLDTKEKLQDLKIPENSIVAFDTETSSLDVKIANIIGFSFSFHEKNAYYVPIAHSYLGVGNQISLDDAREFLKKLFEHKIVGQNLKYDLAVIRHNFNLDFKIHSDTMVSSWLINPEGSHSLDSMAKKYFNHETIKFNNTVKSGESFASVDIKNACMYASEDALLTLKLYNTLGLSDTKQKILEDIEIPFIYVLLDMQKNGIKIDTNVLQTLGSEIDETLKSLTSSIYELAGGEFNIKSTKQLGVVLFETLGLKSGKKTKTGYSTNESVLLNIEDSHEIIGLILEYRELQKLNSTYIKPLIEYANKDERKRIYTSYLHTGTVTGRLSSKNPNLQNIPTRKEMGKQIKKAFIAKEGYKLLAFDYSQIELRLLAHFSKDPTLLKAFNDNKDIHSATAISIFGNDEGNNRSIAKAVNFGLIYGMGANKLARTINVSIKDAKSYIDKYFESFATVKDYIASVEQQVQVDGYVNTLINRQRIFDFDNANGMQKAAYLRDSVNTIFQGSAADIIKMAMNEFYATHKNSDDIKMLLQIHDELIFEVKEEMIDEYSVKIKNIMQNIVELKVPLTVSSKVGNSWYDLEDL
ncbi:MAG: DNA polymerase I (EC [uncultured Campylobacterales bacterium]|uniref:DNA polymerase I n=1 Tax=uncultured Campylobacterales bacterium TaxID=352960 RepID=A0A6S6SQX7_9BACT|nr:MAG: DNA polymerase I (EC [uncultured Campylobacterales bacterium]